MLFFSENTPSKWHKISLGLTVAHPKTVKSQWRLHFLICSPSAAFNAFNLPSTEPRSWLLWSLVPRVTVSCVQQKLPDRCARNGDVFAIFKTFGTTSLMSQWECSDWSALLWMNVTCQVIICLLQKKIFVPWQTEAALSLPFPFSTLDFQSSHFWNILFPVLRETRWWAVLPDKNLGVFLHYRVALFSLCYIYTRGKKEAGKSFSSSKRENNSEHIITNNKFFFYNVINSSKAGFVLGRCFHNYGSGRDRSDS